MWRSLMALALAMMLAVAGQGVAVSDGAGGAPVRTVAGETRRDLLHAPLGPDTDLTDAAEEAWRFLRRFARSDPAH